MNTENIMAALEIMGKGMAEYLRSHPVDHALCMDHGKVR